MLFENILTQETVIITQDKEEEFRTNDERQRIRNDLKG